MKQDKLERETAELADRYCITDGTKFRLQDVDPGDTAKIKHKKHGEQLLELGVELLGKLQEKLYAQDRWGMLLIFQAMDAAGKDGAIKHVMSGVSPQGCDVFSFKAPSTEELNHDFLWRTHKCVPERGKIGIFNRSYYEEVLVVKVHHELLEAEKMPQAAVTKHIWEQRYEDINAHERYLCHNGYVVLKFFLHVSREEQRRRFLARLETPKKNWKFSLADVKERGYWDDYQRAYGEMIQRTATKHAPWYVVPADNKWFTRLVVAGAVIQALNGLDMHYPEVDAKRKAELKKVRETLEKEKD